MVGSIARGFGYLVAGITAWVVAYLAITLVVVGLSYLHLVQTSWLPPLDVLTTLGVLLIYGGSWATTGATLLVGLWWVLGADTSPSRMHRLAVLVSLLVLAALVGLAPRLLLITTAAGPLG